MLAEPKLKQLLDLVKSSEKEELIWMNGYISGIIKGTVPTEIAAPAVTVSKKMTIVYGTETGNSKKLATDFAARAKKKNIPVKLASLDQYRVTDITKEENLFVVISTQGDGEPPAAAQKFYDHIHHNGFRLDNLKYSVLALGDTSYPMFCKTGEEVDAQLQKLGGTPVIPIQKCDVDYESDADVWFAKVIQALNQAETATPAAVKPLPQITAKANTKKVYRGSVLSNLSLNDKGSCKEIYHIELAAEGVDYLPGDSIGIVPENPLAIVQAIVKELGVTGNISITYKDVDYTLSDFLQKKVAIQYLHERVVKKYAAIVQKQIPETKTDLLQLLQKFPLTGFEQFKEVANILPAQSPRIYTIASAPSAHEDELHLTVEKDPFVVNGEKKTGLCSGYLAELNASAEFDFFVQKNKRFKLPANDKDVLLISPGTGVAAARSFISERDAIGATGRNWLFFGEENFTTDFLYQTEIQNWFETGVLTKTSLAFCKDGPEESFIWDKVKQNGKEIYDWIQSGAYIYVSGEKAPMSVEVEKALQQVIETHSGLSAEAAHTYWEQLKEERYSKDVY